MILTVYSLVQATAVAVGRICFGLETSQSSRYMTLLIPGFLGLYFAILALPPSKFRHAGMAVIFLGVFAGCIQRNHKEMEGVAAARHAWAQCFIRTEDVDSCTAQTQTEIELPSTHRNLQDKLLYLKRHRLNLYSSSD